jgi:predicted DNA-binding protein (MmcQ/YjbR family)
VTPKALREWCLSMPGAVEEFPFAPGVSVFKVAGKVFALTRLGERPLTVSVKCDPLLAESLRDSYTSIVPGYHLNKRHWITVTLGRDAADAMVRDLVQDSYDLVKPKRPQARAQRSSENGG